MNASTILRWNKDLKQRVGFERWSTSRSSSCCASFELALRMKWTVARDRRKKERKTEIFRVGCLHRLLPPRACAQPLLFCYITQHKSFYAHLYTRVKLIPQGLIQWLPRQKRLPRRRYVDRLFLLSFSRIINRTYFLNKLMTECEYERSVLTPSFVVVVWNFADRKEGRRETQRSQESCRQGTIIILRVYITVFLHWSSSKLSAFCKRCYETSDGCATSR